LLASAILLLFSQNLAQAGVLLNFDGLADSTGLTTQFPGLTFSSAAVITSGITLNELEFPPHSGNNVVFDDGGPMTISFAPPVQSFSGYFTYSEPLTIRAFNASSVQVATVASHFSSNEALSGVPGSSPNESLQVSSSGGIARVTLTADPAGSSFTLDDLSYTGFSTSVPTLSPLGLLLAAILLGLLGTISARKAGIRGTAASLSVLLFLVAGTCGILAVTAQAQGQFQLAPTVSRQGAGRLGTLSVSRAQIPADRPTPVAVSLRIDDSESLKHAVNLVRFDPEGVPTIVGHLQRSNAARSGSAPYTGQVIITEPAGHVYILASVARRGFLKRAFTEPVNIKVGGLR
jgi:hypothetical protein